MHATCKEYMLHVRSTVIDMFTSVRLYEEGCMRKRLWEEALMIISVVWPGTGWHEHVDSSVFPWAIVSSQQQILSHQSCWSARWRVLNG